MSEQQTQADLEQALENCANEPVHLIGELQPGGALLAFNPETGLLVSYSENLSDRVPQAFETPWQSLFTDETVQRIQGRLKAGIGTAHELVNLTFEGEQETHEGVLYQTEQATFLEFLHGRQLSPSDGRIEARVRDLITELGVITDLIDLTDAVAKLVAELTGFDRVFVYRFREDESGEVISEKLSEGIDSYLGLRFPASDIPAQARRLFFLNPVRTLHSLEGGGSRIQVAPGSGVPDLTWALYRQHSPIHREYLRNMGVTASQVSPITIGDRLWGMISCHHLSGPRMLPFQERDAIRFLAGYISSQVSLLESQEKVQIELGCRLLSNQVIQAITITDDWVPVVSSLFREFKRSLNCSGMAICFDGKVTVSGETPSPEEVANFTQTLFTNASKSVTSSEAFASDWPGFNHWAPQVSGLLALRLSRLRPDYLLFFRPEVLQTTTWAGEPNKGVVKEGSLSRLEPRASFELWKETVKGQSIPWSQEELSIGDTLVSTLTDVVLSAYYIRRELSQNLTRIKEGLASSNDPILMADGLGGVVFANKLFEEKFGKHSKLIQGGLSEKFGIEEEVFEDSLREAVATGERKKLSISSGTILIDPIGSKDGDDDQRGFIIFFR